MVQLLQANCLAFESEAGCVHECVWMWMSLFARFFLFPKLGVGGLGEWDHPAIFARTHTLPQTHKYGHTRLLNDSIWWWVLEGKLESLKVRKLWMVTSTTAGYCHCLDSYTVITAGQLALIINLLHQIHFIISLSLTDRWDGPSSKWQSNWYKVIPFKVYSMNGS